MAREIIHMPHCARVSALWGLHSSAQRTEIEAKQRSARVASESIPLKNSMPPFRTNHAAGFLLVNPGADPDVQPVCLTFVSFADR